MDAPPSGQKNKLNAILNIVAGLLFLGAGFNLLSGGGTIDWLSVILAILFLASGVWGVTR